MSELDTGPASRTIRNYIPRGALFAVGIMVLVTASYLGVAMLQPSTFGFGQPQEAPTQAYVYVALWTFVGVASSVLVSVLRAMPQDAPVNARRLLDGFLYPRTFIALCVSPFVLFGALAAVHAESVGLLTYLGAFQNGFFWQQMLATREGSPFATGASAIKG